MSYLVSFSNTAVMTDEQRVLILLSNVGMFKVIIGSEYFRFTKLFTDHPPGFHLNKCYGYKFLFSFYFSM